MLIDGTRGGSGVTDNATTDANGITVLRGRGAYTVTVDAGNAQRGAGGYAATSWPGATRQGSIRTERYSPRTLASGESDETGFGLPACNDGTLCGTISTNGCRIRRSGDSGGTVEHGAGPTGGQSCERDDDDGRQRHMNHGAAGHLRGAVSTPSANGAATGKGRRRRNSIRAQHDDAGGGPERQTITWVHQPWNWYFV